MQIAFSRFKDFLKEQYPLYECNIKPEFITKDMMVLFVDYLQSRSVGEGAKVSISVSRKWYAMPSNTMWYWKTRVKK